MKLLIALLIVTLALLIPAGAAFAFDPPAQGTDNATDVVLWYGDNLTITSATVSGEVELTGLTDSIESTASDWLSFIIVAFLIVLILKFGGVIRKALAVPVAFVYGFVTASEQTLFSPLWVASTAIGVLGIVFLYEIVAEAVNIIRRKGNQQ